MTRSVLVAAGLALGVVASASGQVLYSATNQTGSRFNAGLDPVGGLPLIIFDDVFVSNATILNQPQVTITSINVGIRRIANAPSTSVSIFLGVMTGTSFGTLGLSSIIPLGSGTLPANGATAVTQNVGGTNALGFATLNVNSGVTGAEGFSGFFVGVALGNADTANGWRVVNTPPAVGASFNGFWEVDSAGFAGPFAFGNPPGSQPSNFMINVEGFGIPTPGTMALLGVAGLAATRRRR
jgi:hypothetical protein